MESEKGTLLNRQEWGTVLIALTRAESQLDSRRQPALWSCAKFEREFRTKPAGLVCDVVAREYQNATCCRKPKIALEARCERIVRVVLSRKTSCSHDGEV